MPPFVFSLQIWHFARKHHFHSNFAVISGRFPWLGVSWLFLIMQNKLSRPKVLNVWRKINKKLPGQSLNLDVFSFLNVFRSSWTPGGRHFLMGCTFLIFHFFVGEVCQILIYGFCLKKLLMRRNTLSPFTGLKWFCPKDACFLAKKLTMEKSTK